MTNGEAIIADMVKEFAARRDLLVRLIAETPLLKANTPEGAFYVMLNISGVLGKRYQGAEITGSDSFAEMLINAKQVAVVPGKAFGADDHVRMSYAISRENIAEDVYKRQNRVYIPAEYGATYTIIFAGNEADGFTATLPE